MIIKSDSLANTQAEGVARASVDDLYDLPPSYYASEGGRASVNAIDNKESLPEVPVTSNDGQAGPSSTPVPSFARAPPANLSSAPFMPLIHISKTGFLEDGFDIAPPQAYQVPHPFVLRDVTEADWVRFLNGMRSSVRLSGGEKVLAGIFKTGFVEANIKHKKDLGVLELIDAWNRQFFGPRRMEVVLAKGDKRLSGRTDLPPPDISAYPDAYAKPDQSFARSRSNSVSSSESSSNSSSLHAAAPQTTPAQPSPPSIANKAASILQQVSGAVLQHLDDKRRERTERRADKLRERAERYGYKQEERQMRRDARFAGGSDRWELRQERKDLRREAKAVRRESRWERRERRKLRRSLRHAGDVYRLIIVSV